MSEDLIVIPCGKNTAEVSWPSYSRIKGGTCDFMTKNCVKHCILETNSIEQESFEFFEDNEKHVIVRKIIKDMITLKSKILCWFIGSGDCPERIQSKVLSVMEEISSMGIRQHGFTRNIWLWQHATGLKKLSLILTVEKDEEIPYHEGAKLIAEPNYLKQTVRIYNHSIDRVATKDKDVTKHVGCGGGWTYTYKTTKDKAPKITVEDCSLCLENNDGCFSIVKT